MAPGAPTPVAPFSHAVRAGDYLFVTGQMPTLPGGGLTLVAGGVEEQTRRVMDNLALVLEAAGASWPDVVQVRVYLTDFPRDFAAMNAVYETYFPPELRPARTCVGVTALAVDALVEIDCIAWVPQT
ncbi:RidA family protein [Roseospira marina]|uniref:RidA family protein n=2 Tax=Roseospira marina TaxID=140057 RepID=A0A5M6I9K8_9PROT|nr:RidA family protein [Roseospira marina]